MKLPVLLAALVLPAAVLAQNPAAAPSAKPVPVQKTPSGLQIEMVKEGRGTQPTASSTVRVHYRGMFPDGREFDSSYKRGEPIEFPLNGVIKCWTEGVAMMKVGGAARLTCPPSIAYGARGAGGVIPPNATLMFEIELLGVR
ncbi:MAG: FKBP-type peptidyl-prolyl cis-trans isomerase [Burkholderiales bacterium]|nr:FKBP-type peptidyl-prolyl cis-trans isomerase [Burkholderiales bacterium]